MKLLKVTFLICLALGMHVIGIGSASSIELRSQTLVVNGHSIQLQVPVGLYLEFLANLSNPRFLTMGPGQEFIIGSRGTDIHRMTKPYDSP